MDTEEVKNVGGEGALSPWANFSSTECSEMDRTAQDPKIMPIRRTAATLAAPGAACLEESGDNLPDSVRAPATLTSKSKHNSREMYERLGRHKFKCKACGKKVGNVGACVRHYNAAHPSSKGRRPSTNEASSSDGEVRMPWLLKVLGLVPTSKARRESVSTTTEIATPPPATPGTSANGRGGEKCEDKKKGLMPNKGDDKKFPKYLVAPRSSIVQLPPRAQFPVQTESVFQLVGDSEDLCFICLDGEPKKGPKIYCDFCPKAFHFRCHLPNPIHLPELRSDSKWRCNYETTKETIDQIISKYPPSEVHELDPLSEENKGQFILASKFLMECYKIPEIPTMRWIFPERYLELYGKVPLHLTFIKNKLLDGGKPADFLTVTRLILAFRRMFRQALDFYQMFMLEHYPSALACFQKFLKLVEDYYPEYLEMKIFNEIKNKHRVIDSL